MFDWYTVVTKLELSRKPRSQAVVQVLGRLHALETLCVENGTLTRKELDDRLAALSKGMH